MTSLVVLVIAMGIVTYVPRMLPMVFLKKINLPPRAKRFLEFTPYAVLASLIFPGVLISVENPISGAIGGIVSVILALFRVNVIFVVIGGVIGVFIAEKLIYG